MSDHLGFDGSNAVQLLFDDGKGYQFAEGQIEYSCPFYLIDPSCSWSPPCRCGGHDADLRSASCQALCVRCRNGRFGHGKAHRGATGITCSGAADRPRQCRGRLRLGSGREPFVAMMKAAELWESDDLARIGWAGRTRLGAVLCERQVGPGSMVIVEIERQDPSQVTRVQYNDMIEAFPPDRSNDALDIRILPR